MNSTTETVRVQNSMVGKDREDITKLTKQDEQRSEGGLTADLRNHLDETAAAAPSSSPSPPSPSTNEPAWDFESFLEEQRRKEVQHDDRKEKVFQKVLSALGGNGDVSGAPELPPEIVQAWGARNEKLSAEARNAQKRQQKFEVRNAVYIPIRDLSPSPSPAPSPAPSLALLPPAGAWACRQRLGWRV